MFLSLCLVVVTIAPMAFASESESEEVAPIEVTPVPNDRVTGILEANGIDYYIENGNIKLKETSPELTEKINGLLKSQFQDNGSPSVFASYPTAWTHMKQYDISRSKKFLAATKTAFVAAFTAWAKNIATPWREVVAVGAGGYAVYYFINSDQEDIFTFVKHYYRELGPGFFDHNGTFIGDYEIRKDIRVTNNSSGTGGNFASETKKSSIIEPWF